MAFATSKSYLFFFSSNNLQFNLTEVTTLIDLLLTVPMTTTESERMFSTMNIVKSFNRTTMTDEWLNAFVSFSVRKVMVKGNEQFKKG